jgi:5-methyltetrahydrofolate--homocysteine methyltransferase
MSFMEALLSKSILIADGATGTILQAAGLPAGVLPEEWNVQEPDKVADMHRAYLDAGSRVILTNTFGGNRLKLARSRKAEDVERFNRAAAGIARRVADKYSAFVGGDMGPTGELMSPMGTLTPDAARQAYAEQAAALASAGVDLLVIETMSDLAEARAAIEGAHDAADLPVVCTMSFDTRGRTMMGVKPEQMMAELWPLGLAAIGANCGKSLDENLEALTRLHEANPEATLWIKANAGLPRLVGQNVVYDTTPAQFAKYALRFAETGASVIGGCCGSTPAHIAAMAQALTSHR